MASDVAAKLKRAARDAAGHSYSPYSNFPVGAAVLTSSGAVYTGTNVENASYGLTMCAEQVAVGCAVSAGCRESAGERFITAVAVFTPTREPTPPCGACLQVISEFAGGDIPILLASKEKERWLRLSQLLPEKFKIERLENNPKEKS